MTEPRLLARVWRFWSRWYRRLATGLCFLVFMISGLLLTITWLPLLRILPIGDERRERWAFALVPFCFKNFMGFMCFVRVIRSFEIHGLEKLRDGGPYLFIANHPTLIDVVSLVAAVGNCNCIVKGALFKHPFMGGVLRNTGLLPNDGGPELLDHIEKNIAKGRHLMIFPEGTRSPIGDIHNFNRGAARLALHCKLPVVPVKITCEPITLRKGEPWWKVPERAVDFRLEFFQPLEEPAEMAEQEYESRKVRILNRHFESFFRDALGVEKQKQMA